MSFEIAAPADADLTAALAPDTFDVLAFVKGQAAPTKTETIFTDADAAFQIAQLLEEEAENDSLSITDGGIDEEELTELHHRLLDSSLEVTYKGLAPAARKALEDHLKAVHPFKEGDDNDEYWDALTHEVTARSIKQIKHVGSGNIDTRNWDVKMVRDFVVDLYPTEQAKLINTAMLVTYVKAEVFDRAVHADFS